MIKNWWSNRYLQRGVWLATLGLVWELIARAGIFNPMLFPTLGTILQALGAAFRSGEMLRAIGLTLLLIGEGLGIGILLALGLAVLSGMSKTMLGMVETLMAVAHPLPGIALLPLVILWLGTGTKAIVFIIVHSVLWPLLVNLLAGFKAVPPIYREVGANWELSPLQNFGLILIPAAFPYLLSGLQIGWARAWRAIISAEMVFGAVGGRGGLGWFIFERRVFMDSPGIYAGLIVIIGIGMVVEELVLAKIEQFTVGKWGMSR